MSEESPEKQEQPQPTRAAGGSRQARGGGRGKRVVAGRGRGGSAKPAGVRQNRENPEAKSDEKTDKNKEGGKPKEIKVPEPKVTLKKFLPVYIIKSENDNVECALCRNQLTEVCNICKHNRNSDPSLCPNITGKCGHTFHQHCLEGWLRDHNTCPIPGCSVRWENA